MSASTESLSLGWISLDLDRYITDAKNAFESYLSSGEEKVESGKLEESLQAVEKSLEIFQGAGLQTAAALTSELQQVLKSLVDGSIQSRADAYQVIIGGINQLLNYLGRLKRSGRENPAIALVVINDLRAVAGKSLSLPSDQFELVSIDGTSSEIDAASLQADLAGLGQEPVTALWQGAHSALQNIAENADDQRRELLNLKRLLIHHDSVTLGVEKSSVVAELLMACEAVVGGALRDGNRLPLTARYVIARALRAIYDTASGKSVDSAEWQQLRDELLFCLCIGNDDSDSSAYLQAKYQLDSAIKIDNKARLLYLGTPDIESIAIVLDSLGEDIGILQNGLQACVEADGDLSACGDLVSMAANLQYTLQLIQYYGLASDLEAIAEQLKSSQLRGKIEQSRLEPMIGKLFEVDSALQKIRAGSGRDTSEIGVIEQLQKSLLEIQDAFSRCAELDIDAALKLVGEQQISAEMASVLDKVPESLLQIAGAAKFIDNDQLGGVIAAMRDYHQARVVQPLESLEIQWVRQHCEKLSRASSVLAQYLAAIKESNHALVDNLLIQVGELIDCSSVLALAAGSEQPDTAQAGNVTSLPVAETASASDDATSGAPEVSAGEDTPAAAGFVEVALDCEIDDEIADIFLEEAEEVFEAINEHFASLQEDRDNQDALAEVRRAYHTLKGSGRMAGAEDIGNAAWAIESLLNRVIDNTIALDDMRLGMVAEANQYMPVLVDYFQRRVQPFAPALQSLIERADIIAKDGDACVELNTSLELEANKNTGPAAANAVGVADDAYAEAPSELSTEPEPVDLAGSTDEPMLDAVAEAYDEESIEDISEASAGDASEEISANTGAKEPVEAAEEELFAEAVEDPVQGMGLLGVFLEEAAQQLDVLQAYCVGVRESGEFSTPDESIERAFHTLAGSAAIAEQVSLAQLMSRAEKLVQGTRRENIFGVDYFACVEKAVSELQELLDRGADRESRTIDRSLLEELDAAIERMNIAQPEICSEAIEEISAHCSLLLDYSDFLKAWRTSFSMPGNFADMQDELRQLIEDSAGKESIVQLCNALLDAYECFAEHGLHYRAYWALNQAHANLVYMLDSLAMGQHAEAHTAELLQQLVAQDREQAALSGEQAPEYTDASAERNAALDREIIGIFLEESTDLIEDVENSVASWVENPGEDSWLEALLRPLHTLKGGARMAGLELIGDTCHDFETLLQSLKAGSIKADAKFFKKIQGQLGNLTNLFGDVTAGEPQAESGEEQGKPEKRVAEAIRVPSDLLDNLVNLAGETSISRSLVEEQLSEFNHSIDEIESTVERLKEQLRRLEIETEAQIAFRLEKVEIEGQEEFDPLEMDRYSQLQQLSKSLVESASDLKDLKSTLRDKTRDVETLLLQQARINTELQEGLMRTRTVPISRTIVPRLRKVIRQVSGELDKPVTFDVGSSDGELDKSVIERMVAPLEHVLRNALDHGIESARERKKQGKPAAGAIRLTINREGSDVVLKISDDGRGIDLDAVREKAIEKGLLAADNTLTDDEVAQVIFSPGFSTAKSVTQISGRGVGMDIVKSEIQELGGSVELQTVKGKGTTFVFRLPFTMSMNRALLVSAGGEAIAVPLDTIEGIVRVSPYELEEYYGENALDFLYAGHKYDFRYLGSVLNGCEPQYSSEMVGALPVLLVRAGDNLIAYQVDRLLGSREIVVKSLGPQFTGLPGIIGATVLGDGSVVMIADLGALGRDSRRAQAAAAVEVDARDERSGRERPLAMVVDDSVTVRKVTTRLLERQGMDVVTAKDGLDAMEKLEELKPDFMLLDIEMPRLDGFEVVSRVRHDPRLEDLPIIMITSRTGEKHRERALSLGANEFLGKPYQEQVLFARIAEVVPELDSQYAVGE